MAESQNSREVRELGFEVAHALDQENASGSVLRRRFIEARAIRAQSTAALRGEVAHVHGMHVALTSRQERELIAECRRRGLLRDERDRLVGSQELDETNEERIGELDALLRDEGGAR